MKHNSLSKIGLGAVATCIACGAMAQTSTNRVNAKTDWSVFQEGGECWIVSAPTDIKITENGRPVKANRSDILLFVTYNKARGIAGEVSYTAGYPLKPNTPVTLRVGSTSYTMAPEGEWAWPTTTADDSKIRASMRRGATAVVVGNSSRGKQTTDTFSLKGFTAALEDAQKRCG